MISLDYILAGADWTGGFNEWGRGVDAQKPEARPKAAKETVHGYK